MPASVTAFDGFADVLFFIRILGPPPWLFLASEASFEGGETNFLGTSEHPTHTIFPQVDSQRSTYNTLIEIK